MIILATVFPYMSDMILYEKMDPIITIGDTEFEVLSKAFLFWYDTLVPVMTEDYLEGDKLIQGEDSLNVVKDVLSSGSEEFTQNELVFKIKFCFENLGIHSCMEVV